VGAMGAPAHDHLIAVCRGVLDLHVQVGKALRSPSRPALNSAGP
jgi:hypothetical protein